MDRLCNFEWQRQSCLCQRHQNFGNGHFPFGIEKAVLFMKYSNLSFSNEAVNLKNLCMTATKFAKQQLFVLDSGFHVEDVSCISQKMESIRLIQYN